MLFNKLTCFATTLVFWLPTVASSLIAPASAQCVQSHTGIQLNISKHQAQQSNDVQFQSQDSCTGNRSSSTSTQVNIGGDSPVRQHQEVRQEVRGSNGNPTGVNGPTVSNGVVVPVNVQTPENFPY